MTTSNSLETLASSFDAKLADIKAGDVEAAVRSALEAVAPDTRRYAAAFAAMAAGARYAAAHGDEGAKKEVYRAVYRAARAAHDRYAVGPQRDWLGGAADAEWEASKAFLRSRALLDEQGRIMRREIAPLVGAVSEVAAAVKAATAASTAAAEKAAAEAALLRAHLEAMSLQMARAARAAEASAAEAAQMRLIVAAQTPEARKARAMAEAAAEKAAAEVAKKAAAEKAAAEKAAAEAAEQGRLLRAWWAAQQAAGAKA